eukprot:GHVN01081759.1.p2 GENE.GHVN01081759.1~~GHVN01081759.1.p2  ORF type:complete len:211 (+),score=57.43 GHVN01081759.1:1723-2355(+)
METPLCPFAYPANPSQASRTYVTSATYVSHLTSSLRSTHANFFSTGVFLFSCLTQSLRDRMTNQKAVSFVRENEELTSLTSLTPSTSLLHSDLAVTCEKMCFQCLSGNPLLHEGAGCDNMTAMIVRFRSSLTSTPSASDDTSLELSTSLTSLYRYGKWGDDGPNTSELLDTTEGRATLLKARTTENATRPRKRADSSEESDEESTRQRGE